MQALRSTNTSSQDAIGSARRTALVTFALTFVIASRGSVAAAPAPSRCPANLSELHFAIAEVLRQQHVPGAAVALVNKSGAISTICVGQADLAGGRPVTNDTLFRFASISKSFVALALLRLYEEHKIDFEAKFNDIAPEIPLPNRWEATSPVRVANVLEHTAGLGDESLAEVYDFGSQPIAPTELFRQYPGPQRVGWEPGTWFSYSNVDYELAAYLIRKLTGESCEQYISENVLSPLGMTHSAYALSSQTRRHLAQGYVGDPPTPIPYLPLKLRCADELKSSPSDMSHFLIMLLNRGTLDGVKFLRLDSIARMERSTTSLAARHGLTEGYGLANQVNLEHGVTMRGHLADIPGFGARYWYMPDQGLGYVVAINGDVASGGGAQALERIDSLLFGYSMRGVPKAPKRPEVALNPQMLNWIGFYRIPVVRYRQLSMFYSLLAGHSVFQDHGYLFLRWMLGPPARLIPVSSNQFRMENQPQATILFHADRFGRRVVSLSEWGQYFFPEDLVESSPWPLYFQLVMVAVCLLIIASYVPLALAWIPLALLKRARYFSPLSTLALPLAAVASGVLSFWLIYGPVATDTTYRLATLGPRSLGFFLGTWCFAALSVCALVLTLRSFRWPTNRWVRLHSLAVSVACCWLVAYLSYWGFIGLKTWR
jgi:CubicO group peptidase (beta-lactamase class C family)